MRSSLFLLMCLALAACTGESSTADDHASIKSGTNIHTLDNNGDKIRWEKSELRKGVKIFNLTMQEFGVVTGEIVVVSKQLPIEELKQQYIVRQQQGASYTLVLKSESDLALALKRLRAMPQIQVVELQIDYSPIETVQTM
ncbi:hypothetical protein [Pseudoalteromonas sp. GB56]